MQQQQQRQQQQRQKVQRHPIRVDCIWYNPSGKPRLFVCQVCTRAFARLEHLRRHERSHTKENHLVVVFVNGSLVVEIYC